MSIARNTIAVDLRATQSGARAVAEVATAYTLLEAALWSRGMVQLAWTIVTLAWVVSCTWRSGRSRSELGTGRAGLRRSLWIVPFAFGVSAVMLAGAYFTGSLHDLSGARAPVWHALVYAVWALLQEYLAMSFIFVRLEQVIEPGQAVLATGILFCLAHIPNIVLMGATLLIGVLFCWTFRRFRNIYPIAIAHAVLGLALSVTVSSTLTHNMRVGIAYWF